MRATLLTSLAVLALAMPARTCFAQATIGSRAPQTLTGPGGIDGQDPLSPSTLPRTAKDAPIVQSARPPADQKTPGADREAAKPAREPARQVESARPAASMTAEKAGGARGAEAAATTTGRVGTLSPDEQRRAARSRARAAAAERPAAHTDERTTTDAKASAFAASPTREPAASRPAPSLTAADVRRPNPQPAKAPPPMAEVPRVDTHRTRMASTPEVRRTRRRVASSSTRRAMAADAGRVPKVGDVVPFDVPLLPLPPGATRGRPMPRGYGEVAMDAPRQPWRYAPPPPPYMPAYAYPRPYAVYGNAW